MVDTSSEIPEVTANDADSLTTIELGVEDADPNIFDDFTIREVQLAESLLTPGLQTSFKVHSYFHSIPVKNFDTFKNKNLVIRIDRPGLSSYFEKTSLDISQTLYRLGGRSSTSPLTTDNRKLINRSVEELTFHACDKTLLNDAANLVSKSWKCTTPSAIVEEVLSTCAGARVLDIEDCDPAKDFVAENKHPFQVVSQQANAALAAGNDPSFVHYMTYENYGTHHFRSLYSLSQQAPIIELEYNMIGSSYSYPYSIMNYTFPCDFDLLSDILNGVGSSGADINSLAIFNPLIGLFSLMGDQSVGCGIGGGVYKIAMSNQGSAGDQFSCPDFVSTYLPKRQARMALLERDKIALRLTVPWNPIYNAGKVIKINLKNDQDSSILNYGSGNYLIVSLIHTIRSGGYSTITMDCVSQTVGQGEV